MPATAQESSPSPNAETQAERPAAQRRSFEPAAEARSTSSTNTPRPVRLAIDGLTPGLQVRVFSKSEPLPQGASTATCTQDCELALPKGTYTLIASRGDDQRAKDIDLTSSQVVTVGEWDGTVRTLGTVMGITGIAVAAIGAFVTVASLVAPTDPHADYEAPPGRAGVFLFGIVGLGIGTGLALGGFSLAAANQGPSMDLQRMPMTRRPAGSAATGISLGGKF